MAKTFHTDLSDFVGPDGFLVGEPAGRLAKFLSHVVEVGTASGGVGWFDSALPCRHAHRRRKRCEGYIRTLRASDRVVQWQCPSCGENGEIAGWAKWVWDLSWAAQEESSRAFEVFLHDEELAALRDAESVSVETPEIVARATRRGSRAVITGTAERLITLLDCVDVDSIKISRRKQRILSAIRWRLAAAIPSNYLWQRLNKPEPFADRALLEREHDAAWLRMRINELMHMASPEWRFVSLFSFALHEVLANIMALSRREPQASLVLLEHYLGSVSRIQDDVHDETGIPELWVEITEQAQGLATAHGLDRRHFIAKLLEAAAIDETCRLIGEAVLPAAEREWVRAETARLGAAAQGARRKLLSDLGARLDLPETVH